MRNKKAVDSNAFFPHKKTLQKLFLSKIGMLDKSISHKVWIEYFKYLR